MPPTRRYQLERQLLLTTPPIQQQKPPHPMRQRQQQRLWQRQLVHAAIRLRRTRVSLKKRFMLHLPTADLYPGSSDTALGPSAHTFGCIPGWRPLTPTPKPVGRHGASAAPLGTGPILPRRRCATTAATWQSLHAHTLQGQLTALPARCRPAVQTVETAQIATQMVQQPTLMRPLSPVATM